MEKSYFQAPAAIHAAITDGEDQHSYDSASYLHTRKNFISDIFYLIPCSHYDWGKTEGLAKLDDTAD